MLTRKPSAAAPAAYPTGKEGRAATPPRAPAPAGPRAARVQPSWRGRPLPAGPRTKSARRRGPRADGAPSPRLRSLLHAGPRAPSSGALQPGRRGLSRAFPPAPARGLARPSRPCRRSNPLPGLRPLATWAARPRPGPARLRRRVANSRAGARLNFAAARAPPGAARLGSAARVPFSSPGRLFLPSGLSPRESGVRYPEGWGGATGSG